MAVGNTTPLDREFFLRDAETVARDLIGVTLLVDGIGGEIVETEAYDQNGDKAAHCYNCKDPETPWKTALNKSMFLAGGHAYVCPGRHLLHLNLVCGVGDEASAVLIRAIQPLSQSIPEMRRRREPNFKNPPSDRSLCAGPGCVAESLGIGCEHDGQSLYDSPFQFYARKDQIAISRGARIGTKDRRKRRYIWTSNPYVSKKMDDAEPVS